MLFYKGKIDGIKKREYQGRARAHLQFVITNDVGELAFMEIKVPDSIDPNRFRIGAQCEIPVTYSVVQGEVYFKIPETASSEDIKVSAAK